MSQGFEKQSEYVIMNRFPQLVFDDSESICSVNLYVTCKLLNLACVTFLSICETLFYNSCMTCLFPLFVDMIVHAADFANRMEMAGKHAL